MPAVEPLQDEEVLTDTTGKKWTPVKLLSQSTTELTYEGETKNICAISTLNDICTFVFHQLHETVPRNQSMSSNW